jgi:hypothetical protein
MLVFYTIAAAIAIMMFWVGITMGYVLLEKQKRLAFRKRFEQTTAPRKDYEDTRKEPRSSIAGPVEITVPLLDDFGMATGEHQVIFATLLNLSNNGCAVIAQQFIRPNLEVRIEAKSRKLSLHVEKAWTRYNYPTSKGLQIGFKFAHPIHFNLSLSE